MAAKARLAVWAGGGGSSSCTGRAGAGGSSAVSAQGLAAEQKGGACGQGAGCRGSAAAARAACMEGLGWQGCRVPDKARQRQGKAAQPASFRRRQGGGRPHPRGLRRHARARWPQQKRAEEGADGRGLGQSARARRGLRDNAGGGECVGERVEALCAPAAHSPPSAQARSPPQSARPWRKSPARAQRQAAGASSQPANHLPPSHLAGHSQAGGTPRSALLGGGAIQLQKGAGRAEGGGESARLPGGRTSQSVAQVESAAPGPAGAANVCVQAAAREAWQADRAVLLATCLARAARSSGAGPGGGPWAGASAREGGRGAACARRGEQGRGCSGTRRRGSARGSSRRRGCHPAAPLLLSLRRRRAQGSCCSRASRC